MIIDILECYEDGTQKLVPTEVPDDYFDDMMPESEPGETLADRVSAVEADLSGLTAAVEKGLSL